MIAEELKELRTRLDQLTRCVSGLQEDNMRTCERLNRLERSHRPEQPSKIPPPQGSQYVPQEGISTPKGRVFNREALLTAAGRLGGHIHTLDAKTQTRLRNDFFLLVDFVESF